jgi:hypothetical protein
LILVSDLSNRWVADTDLNPPRPSTPGDRVAGRAVIRDVTVGAPRFRREDEEDLAGPGVLGGDVGSAVQDGPPGIVPSFEEHLP